jgi:hypothetical protein
MIFETLCWVCLSITFCVSIHFVIIRLNGIYTNKKIKYLGEFENEKYQEIINQLEKKEHCRVQKYDYDYQAELSEEMTTMKNSLIELMNNTV